MVLDNNLFFSLRLEHPVERVVVMQLGKLEDLALLKATLPQLRQLLPSSTICLLTASKFSRLAKQLSWVDQVLVYEGVLFSSTAAQELALIEELGRGKFDVAFILTNPPDSPYPLAYMCYLAGIPLRFGRSLEFGGGVLSHH